MFKDFPNFETLNSDSFLKSAWQQYLEHVMPGNAPIVQREETEQAFYCGALVFYAIMSSDQSEEYIGTLEAFTKWMENCHNDFLEYFTRRVLKVGKETPGLSQEEVDKMQQAVAALFKANAPSSPSSPSDEELFDIDEMLKSLEDISLDKPTEH